MSVQVSISDSALNAELSARGLNYQVANDHEPIVTEPLPAALLPLNHVQQCRLKLFYTAATLLQRVHQEQLRQYIPNYRSLPDLFAGSLGLELTAPPRIQLQQLSDRHRVLSGITANWLGSYTYAAERLFSRLAKETAWAA